MNKYRNLSSYDLNDQIDNNLNKWMTKKSRPR